MAFKLNKPQSVNYLLYSMGGGAFLGSIINSYSLPYYDYNIDRHSRENRYIDYMNSGIKGAIVGAGAGIFLPLTFPFIFVGLSTGILLHENNDKEFVEDYVDNLS
jgi:hypothetical protein